MTFVRTHRSYQHDHLITELNGQTARCVFRHKHGLLTQETFADARLHTLMAVSDTDSVMTEYGQGHVRFAGLVTSASGSKEAGEVMIGAGVGLMGMGAVIRPRALGRYLTGSSAPESSAGSRSSNLAGAPVPTQNDQPPSYEIAAANLAAMNAPHPPADIPPPSYDEVIALRQFPTSQTQNAIDSRNPFGPPNSFSPNDHASAIRGGSNL